MEHERSSQLPGVAGTWHHVRERGAEMDTPAAIPEDFLPPELMQLLATARRVINRHVNGHGNCTACGSSWPCQHAQLAEFSLGAL